MQDNIKEFYGILEDSKDFKGVYANEDELRRHVTKSPSSFYKILSSSEEFKGIYKDEADFIKSLGLTVQPSPVKKKENISVGGPSASKSTSKSSIPNLVEGQLKTGLSGEDEFEPKYNTKSVDFFWKRFPDAPAVNPDEYLKEAAKKQATSMGKFAPIKSFEQRMWDKKPLSIKNEDGTESTHEMASAEVDGKYIAYPTIVQKGPGLQKLSDKDAFEYALQNKEYKEFKTEKEARAYAEGGYKENTPLGDKVPTLTQVLEQKAKRNLEYMASAQPTDEEVSKLVNKEMETYMSSPENVKLKEEFQAKLVATLEQMKAKLQEQVQLGQIKPEEANGLLQQESNKMQESFNAELNAKWSEYFNKNVKPRMNKSIAETITNRYMDNMKSNDLLSSSAKQAIDEMVKKDEFQAMSIDQKKKAISQTWQLTKASLKRKGKSDDFIQRYKEQYMAHFVTGASVTEKGLPSSYAIREWSDVALKDIDERIKDIMSSPEYDEVRAKTISAHGRPSNKSLLGALSGEMTPEMKKGADIYDELQDLESAKAEIKKMLAMPENLNGTMWEGFKYGFAQDLNIPLPMVSTAISLSNNINLYKAAKKAESGQKLTEGEKFLLQSSGMKNSYEQAVKNNYAFKIARGATVSVPFMMDMVIGGWASAPIRKTVEASISKLAPKIAEKAAFKYGVVKPLGVIMGEAARTAADPAKWANSTIEHMAPEIRWAFSEEKTPEGGKIENQTNIPIEGFITVLDKATESWGQKTGKGMEFGEALAYGFLDNFKENLSEQMGGAFDAGASGVLSYLTKNNEWAKRLYIGYLLKMNGGMTTSAMQKTMLQLRQGIKDQAGLNGFIGENLEEFASAIMEDFMYNRSFGQSFTPEFLKETAGVTGLVQVPMAALGLGVKVIDKVSKNPKSLSFPFVSESGKVNVEIPASELNPLYQAMLGGKISMISYLHSDLGKTNLEPQQRQAIEQYVKSNIFWTEAERKASDLFGASFESLDAIQKQEVFDAAQKAVTPYFKSKDAMLLESLRRKMSKEEPGFVYGEDEQGEMDNTKPPTGSGTPTPAGPATTSTGTKTPNTETPSASGTPSSGQTQPIDQSEPIFDDETPLTTDEEEDHNMDLEVKFDIADKIAMGTPLSEDDYDVIKNNIAWFEGNDVEVPAEALMDKEERAAFSQLTPEQKQAYLVADEEGRKNIISPKQEQGQVLSGNRFIEKQYPAATRDFMDSARNEFLSINKLSIADYNELPDAEKDRLDTEFKKYLDEMSASEEELVKKPKKPSTKKTQNWYSVDDEAMMDDSDLLAMELSGVKFDAESLKNKIGNNYREWGSSKGNSIALSWFASKNGNTIDQIAEQLSENDRSPFYGMDQKELEEMITEFIITKAPTGATKYIKNRVQEFSEKRDQEGKEDVKERIKRELEEMGIDDFELTEEDFVGDEFIDALSDADADKLYEAIMANYGDDIARLAEDISDLETGFSPLGLLFDSVLPGIDIDKGINSAKNIYEKAKSRKEAADKERAAKTNAEGGIGTQQVKEGPKIGNVKDVNLDGFDLDVLLSPDLFGGDNTPSQKSQARKDYEALKKQAIAEIRDADKDLRNVRNRIKNENIPDSTAEQILRPKISRYQQALKQLEIVNDLEKKVAKKEAIENSQQTLFSLVPNDIYTKKLNQDQIDKGNQIIDRFFGSGVYGFGDIAATIQAKVNDDAKFEQMLPALIALYGQKLNQVEDAIADQMDDRKSVRAVIENYFNSKKKEVEQEYNPKFDALKDVESTTKALEEVSDVDVVPDAYMDIQDLIPENTEGKDIDLYISEAYHKAKADGSNPELVQAVEELLTKNNNDTSNDSGGTDAAKDKMGPGPILEGTKGNGGGNGRAGSRGSGSGKSGNSGNSSSNGGAGGIQETGGTGPGNGAGNTGNSGGGTTGDAAGLQDGREGTGDVLDGDKKTDIRDIGPGSDLSFSEKVLLQQNNDVPVSFGVKFGAYDIDAHRKNVDETLPVALTSQREDVRAAEESLNVIGNKAVLFTNGTGTGKTTTALSIAYRAVKKGKRVLIVTPKQDINKNFTREGDWFKLDVYNLENTKDSGAGKQVVVTTMKNMSMNSDLLRQEFDYVIVDESDNLMANLSGDEGDALDAFRFLSNYSRYAEEKALMQLIPGYADEYFKNLELMREIKAQDSKIKQMVKEAKEAGILPDLSIVEFDKTKLQEDLIASNNALSVMKRVYFGETSSRFPGNAVSELSVEEKEQRKKLFEEQTKRLIDSKKVVFMSATPFHSEMSLGYAENYLFDYPNGDFNQFMIDNFGYRIRYSKLTQPKNSYVIPHLQRAFHERLKAEKKLFSRQLASDYDYSRDFFLLVDPEGEKSIGAMIDSGIEILRREFELGQLVDKKFNFLYSSRLSEAYKARIMIPQIRDMIQKGYKVVIFHNFNVPKEQPLHPFEFSADMILEAAKNDLELARVYRDKLDQFNRKYPQYSNLDMKNLLDPGEALSQEFPEESVLFRGGLTDKQRVAAIEQFNKGGKKLFIVNKEAGKAGISLHDVVGDSPRILVQLGLPIRANDAIQSEGRIYRVGNKSNASFLYPVIHTTFERIIFSQKVGVRSAGAENFALGDNAKGLDVVFREDYMDAESGIDYDQIGKGGKEREGKVASLTPFKQAIVHYDSRERRSKNSPFRGVDYFPTPEPVGFKMVEWASVQPGMKVLEPSAGVGSIARYIPNNADVTIVEPNYDNMSKAALVVVNPDLRKETIKFEDLSSVNKFDRIVMNPPFGTAGAIAFTHLEKAFKSHLNDYGRIVAIVPDSPRLNAKIKEFLDANPEAVVRAFIKLPKSTFQKDSTSVITNVIVIDKYTNPEVNSQARAQNSFSYTVYTGFKDLKINELFDAIEDFSVVEPILPPDTDEDDDVNVESRGWELVKNYHAKDKRDNWVVKTDGYVQDFGKYTDAAKRFGGYYSKYSKEGAIPGFQFKNEESAKNFLEWIKSISEPKLQVEVYHGSPHRFNRFTTEKMGTGEGVQAFGWGLYFTDLESIARGYADKLSKPNHSKFRQKLLKDNPPSHVINDIIDFSEYYEYDYDKVLEALIKNENKEGIKYLTENKDLFNSVERNLYKVTLHKGKTPDQYTWLEWDKPLTNEQRNLVIKAIEDKTFRTWTAFGDPLETVDRLDTTGKDVYISLEKEYGAKKASLMLLEAGIDGIKYPAESISRGATSDTARGFNYVVFDENAVTIEEITQFQIADITPITKEEIAFRDGMSYAFGKAMGVEVIVSPSYQWNVGDKIISPTQKVMGAFIDGKVYIDPTVARPDTPIHEFGHAWVRRISQTKPEVLKRGFELMNDTEYLKDVQSSPAYANDSLESQQEEALVRAIADRGVQILDKFKRKDFLDYLREFWAYVKDLAGFDGVTVYQLQKMDLAEFTSRAVGDMLNTGSSSMSEQKNISGEKLQVKLDRDGNQIGDGSYHASYNTIDFPGYPQVSSSVSKSQSTESVYVTYTNSDNGKTVTVRFSNHENNAVKFGDQLDGNYATKGEILYHLGLINRTFVPDTRLFIDKRMVKDKEVGNYQEADLTIGEMYALGKDADISQYKGMLAKGSKYLILGDKVVEEKQTGINALGQTVYRGKFIYDKIVEQAKADLSDPYNRAKYELQKAWKDQGMPLGIMPQPPKDPFSINLFAKAVRFAYEAIKKGARSVGEMLSGTGFKINQWWRDVFDSAKSEEQISDSIENVLLSNEDNQAFQQVMEQVKMMNPQNKEDLMSSLRAVHAALKRSRSSDKLLKTIASLREVARVQDFDSFMDMVDDFVESPPLVGLNEKGGVVYAYDEKDRVMDYQGTFSISQEAKDALNSIGIVVREKSRIPKALGRFFLGTKITELRSLMDIRTAIHEGTHYILDINEMIPRIKSEGGSLISDMRDSYMKYYPEPFEKKERAKLDKVIHEGMAMLVERYLVDPVGVELEYPNLVKEFIKPTGKFYVPMTGELIDKMLDLRDRSLRMDLPRRIEMRLIDWNTVVKKSEFLKNYTWKNITPAHVGLWRWLKYQINTASFTKELDNLAKTAYSDQSLDIAYFNATRANSVANSWLVGSMPYRVTGEKFSNATAARIGAAVEDAGAKMGMSREDSYRAFDGYLISRRLVGDYNRMIDAKNELDAYQEFIDSLEDGPTPIQAQILERLQEKYDNLRNLVEANNPDPIANNANIALFENKFKDATKIFDELNRNLLLFSVKHGLITQEQYNDWGKNEDYASFERFLFDDVQPKAFGPKGGAPGNIGRSGAFKQRKGSANRAFVGPYTSMLSRVPEIINKGYQNSFWERFASFVAANGKSFKISKNDLFQDFKYLPKTGKVNPDGTIDLSHLEAKVRSGKAIAFYKNGKRVYFEVAPWVESLASTLTPEVNNELIEGFVKYGSDLFTKMTTAANPLFALGNLAVDQISTMMTTKTIKILPVVDELFELGKEYQSLLEIFGKKVGDVLKKDSKIDPDKMQKLMKYLSMGGSNLTLMGSFDNVTMGDLISRVNPDGSLRQTAGDVVNKITDFLGAPVNTTEVMTRFGEFSRALDMGHSLDVAMYMASQVSVPFHEKGMYGGKLGRTWVRSVSYAGASIRATEKLLRAAKENPKRVGAMIGILSSISAGTILYGLLEGDDDDWVKILSLHPEDFSKYMFVYVNGEWQKYRMPEPFSAIFGLVQMGMVATLNTMQKGKPSTYSKEQYFRELTGALPWGVRQFEKMVEGTVSLDAEPVGVSIMESIPTALVGTTEVALGIKHWPTIQPLIPDYLEKKKPMYQKDKRSSWLAIELGKMENVSPIKIDHFLKAQFGQNARFILDNLNDDPRGFKAPWEYNSDYTWLRGRHYSQFKEHLKVLEQTKNSMIDEMENLYDIDKNDLKAIFEEQEITVGDFNKSSNYRALANKNKDAADFVKEFYKEYLVASNVAKLTKSISETHEVSDLPDEFRLKFFYMLADYNSTGTIDPESVEDVANDLAMIVRDTKSKIVVKSSDEYRELDEIYKSVGSIKRKLKSISGKFED